MIRGSCVSKVSSIYLSYHSTPVLMSYLTCLFLLSRSTSSPRGRQTHNSCLSFSSSAAALRGRECISWRGTSAESAFCSLMHGRRLNRCGTSRIHLTNETDTIDFGEAPSKGSPSLPRFSLDQAVAIQYRRASPPFPSACNLMSQWGRLSREENARTRSHPCGAFQVTTWKRVSHSHIHAASDARIITFCSSQQLLGTMIRKRRPVARVVKCLYICCYCPALCFVDDEMENWPVAADLLSGLDNITSKGCVQYAWQVWVPCTFLACVRRREVCRSRRRRRD